MNQTGLGRVLTGVRERRTEWLCGTSRPDAQGTSALGVTLATYFDRTDTGEITRPLRNRLNATGVVSLGALSGAELCVAGATEHPVCWEPLKTAWEQLDDHERSRISSISTLALLSRSLIENQPHGRGVMALLSPYYRASAELGILLDARSAPTLIITTRNEPGAPEVTYYHPRGSTVLIQEIPERDGCPLETTFSYWLLAYAFAAEELARWTLNPASEDQRSGPRLIRFSTRTEAASPTTYELIIRCTGDLAHVDAPDLSADLTPEALTSLLTDAITRLAPPTRRSPRPRHP